MVNLNQMVKDLGLNQVEQELVANDLRLRSE